MPTATSPVGVSDSLLIRKSVDEVVHDVCRYDVPEDLAAQAARLLAPRDVTMLGMSAKLAGGKDSTAPPVLSLLGVRNYEQHSFAFALKNELDQMIEDIRYWGSHTRVGESLSEDARWSLATFVSNQHNIPVQQSFDYFTGDFAIEVLRDPSVHSRMRTTAVRAALQHLGTDVRRAQDPLYWIKRTVRPAVERLAAGTSVCFTDDRFPNEVDSVRALTGVAVRLDVTRETQLARLATRDGIAVTNEQLDHESETALDDYPNFDVRVSNDGAPEQTLEAIRSRLGELQLLR